MTHIFNLFSRGTFSITLSTKRFRTHFITQFQMGKLKNRNRTPNPLYIDKTQLSKVRFIQDLFNKYFCSEQSLPETRQSEMDSDAPEFEKWSSLETDAIQNTKGVSSFNFDCLTMIMLRSEKLYDRAQSFLDYVNTVRVPNDVTLANFMALAAECKDEARVFEVYEKIDKAFLVVPSLALLVIEGLSKTSRWKECLELIRQLGEMHIPAWMALSQAAFRHGDTSTGKQLIQELVQSGIEPKSEVFSTWLKLIQSLNSRLDVDWLTNQLLTCLRKTEHILTLPNAVLLKGDLVQAFLLSQWRKIIFSVEHQRVVVTTTRLDVDYSKVFLFCRLLLSRQIAFIATNKKEDIISTVIRRTGECPCCGYHLECPTLSKKEHAQLEKVFLEQLYKGSDSFHDSSPKELRIYLNFLEKSKPYDIVVDALNVAHKQPRKQPYYLAQQLLSVVSQLYHQNLKILVLGKKHIWFWNKGMLTQVENMAKCFYADNISSDDPFMIYGALYGGPETLLLTSDMMRDHHYSLQEEESKELFRRWVISRQVSFTDGTIDSRLQIEVQIPRNKICDLILDYV